MSGPVAEQSSLVQSANSIEQPHRLARLLPDIRILKRQTPATRQAT